MAKARAVSVPTEIPVRKITQQLKRVPEKQGWSALPSWARYILALLVTGAALLLGTLLRSVPGVEVPGLLFAFGVLLSARFGGLGPGLVATCLSVLALDYAFLEPIGRFWLGSPAAQIHTMLLLGVGAFCCFLMEEMHRTRQRADDDALALEEGERFLQNLVRNLPGAAYRCRNDPERTLDYISEGAFALSGYRPAELIESQTISFTRLIHPEDRPWVQREIQEALHERRPYHFVYRIRTAFRKEKWVWEKGQGVYSPEGELLALEGFLSDITERKQAEEKLKKLFAQEQQGRMRATFLAETSDILAGSLDDMAVLHAIVNLLVPRLADFAAVCLLDEDGSLGPEHPLVIASTNPEAERALQELRRRYPSRKSHPVWEILRARKVRLYTSEPPFDIEEFAEDEELQRLLMHLRWRSCLAVPLATRFQTLGCLIIGSHERAYEEDDCSLMEEIGRRATLAIDNARLYREARNAVRARDEFLSIASHELKTPLTPIRLKLQGLLRLCQKETQAELALQQISPKLEITIRQLDRLHRLIEELLDLSRISVGKLSLNPEPTDLTDLLHEVLERFADELRRANCPLHLHVSGPVWGYWDKLRLEQILANLLSNAIKYGAGKPIDLSLESDETHAWFRIRDQGIGIEPCDQERIFQRFERAVSDRHYGGFGLGLWIARQIAEAAGGSISVHSRPGQGALFTLELPRSPTPTAPDSGPPGCADG